MGLLRRYVRRFAEWRPVWYRSSAIASVGRRQKKKPPPSGEERVAACGSAAELTMQLVKEFRTTCFRTYRCHQPSLAQ